MPQTITFDQNDWNNTPADVSGEFERLTAGGYVCKIVASSIVKSKAGNLMLALNVDIAEGEFAGYFGKTQAYFKNEKWPNDAIIRQVLYRNNGGISPRFKGLIMTIEKSNADFRFNPAAFDPESLRGKLIGCVFADHEYVKADKKTIGQKAAVFSICTVDDIHNDNFTVPVLQKLGNNTETADKSNNQNNDPVDNQLDLEDPPF